MKMKKLGIRLGLVAAALSALAGCASAPRAAEVQLPDPKTVPREKWSDAMNVLNAMGIEGQRDIPKELAGQVPGTIDHGTNPAGSGADLAMGAVGFASPPTGFSSGGALGMGVGLFLLGGGGAQPVGITQIAAWVPAELASSPEEAARIVAVEWDKARNALGKGNVSKVQTVTAKYPHGTVRKEYATVADSYLRRPVQPDQPSHQAPSFVSAKNAFGPIFILPDQVAVDASKNGLEKPEQMRAVANYLPEWFFLYYPGLKERKRMVPAAIYTKNKTMFFVGK